MHAAVNWRPSASLFSRLLLARAARIDAGEVARNAQIEGVVLFVDLVASTTMTERIAGSGPDGAERLSTVLNSYFSEVIDVIAAHGGDVIRIDGDAVIALWRTDLAGPRPAEATGFAPPVLAARAALALRGLDRLWPTTPPEPLRYRMTLVSGKFNAVVLSGRAGRRFFVLIGEPLQTIAAISHRGSPGDIVVDRTTASLLAPHMAVQPLADSDAIARGATVLLGVHEQAALTLRSENVSASPAARAFLPRIVVNRNESGLSEFRLVSLVCTGLGRSDLATTAAAEQLQAAFDIVAEAAEALGIEIFDVIANEKGIIANIVCGLPPLVQESNAARAVEIARRVREKLAMLGAYCSVGVATGPAFCGDIGNATRREYVLNGPVMSYGTRLMEVAGGEVLCDRDTASAAGSRFAFSPATPMTMKGAGTPFMVQRLIAAQLVSARSPGLPTGGLHGRDAELGKLASWIEPLAAGRGGLCMVEGEPGAGKSRLLTEFGRIARQRGCGVVSTATHAIEQATAYFAFRPVLEQLLRRPEDPDEAPAPLRQRLAEAMAGTELEARAALIEDILPLGIEDPGLAPQIRGSARQTGIEDIVVVLVQRLAAERPLLLLFDDLHWSDALSTRLLRALAQRVPNVLIVTGSRPLDAATPQAEALIKRAAIRIRLQPLEAQSVSQMVCDLLGIEVVPRRLADVVQAQSEGLPFHAEQLVLSLRDKGLIEVADGRCRVLAADLTTATVPYRLRDVIVSRIERLAETDQLVARIASVIGRVFDFDSLCAICPPSVDAGNLKASLHSLVRAGVLAPVPAQDGCYGFHHVVTQETVYELLSFAQRGPLHRQVAELIERRHARHLDPHFAELAHHWELAGALEKPIRYRLRAAQLALRRYANDDALMHAERAERLVRRRSDESAATRAEIANIRGEAFHATSRFAQAGEQFKECLALNNIRLPPTASRMAVATLGEAARQGLHRLGWMRKPRDAAAQERARLSAHLHTRFAEHAWFTTGTLPLLHGMLTALNKAESVGAVPEMIEGNGGLAIGLGLVGRHGMAQRYRDRSIALAERYGAPHDLGWAHLLAGVYSFQAGNAPAARSHSEKGAEICARLGDRSRYQSHRFMETFSAVATGDYAHAAETLALFVPPAPRVQYGALPAWVLAGLSILDMLQGCLPEETLDRMAATRDQRLRRGDRLMCDGLTAAALLQAGDAEAADDVAARALDTMTESVSTTATAMFSVSAVIEVHLALAERTAASGAARAGLLTRAQAACRAIRRYSGPTAICRPRADVLAGRMALLQGRRTQAEGLFRRGLACASQFGLPLEQALCRRALAGVCRDPAEQVGHVRESGAALAALGAKPWDYTAHRTIVPQVVARDQPVVARDGCKGGK